MPSSRSFSSHVRGPLPSFPMCYSRGCSTAASIQVVLLASEAAHRNLAITRASLHLVFSAAVTGLYLLAACRTLPETHRVCFFVILERSHNLLIGYPLSQRDPELADGPTNTAGAWYDRRADAGIRSLHNVSVRDFGIVPRSQGV